MPSTFYAKRDAIKLANESEFLYPRDNRHVIVKNACIIWTDFGAQKVSPKYGKATKGTINLVVPPHAIKDITEMGFKTKRFEYTTLDGDNEFFDYIEIKFNVEDDKRNPDIVICQDFNGRKTKRQVKPNGALDGYLLEKVCVTFHPFDSDGNGRNMSAYLDDLEAKRLPIEDKYDPEFDEYELVEDMDDEAPFEE